MSSGSHLENIIIIIFIYYYNNNDDDDNISLGGGGQKKRKGRKTWKRRSEEKVVGFSSATLLPTRKWEAVTQGGTMGIDHLMRRRTQRAGIIKGWEDKRYHGRIPDTFT